MQLHISLLAFLALSSNVKVANSHIVRTPLASSANINGMDDIPVAALGFAESGFQTAASVPHDVPEHPHCTYKGADSRMFMVFSKDFGLSDETSKDGCGSDMLHHLRKECGGWIVNWSCVSTPKGEHSSFMEFKVPILTSNAGPECVEKAFRSASGPKRQQLLNCCPRGDLGCRKRNCEAYREKNAGLKC